MLDRITELYVMDNSGEMSKLRDAIVICLDDKGCKTFVGKSLNYGDSIARACATLIALSVEEEILDWVNWMILEKLGLYFADIELVKKERELAEKRRKANGRKRER